MEYSKKDIEQRLNYVRDKLNDICQKDYENKSHEYNGLCVVEKVLIDMLKNREKE